MDQNNTKLQETNQTNSPQATPEKTEKSTLQSFLKKFSSRKFIMSFIGVVVGILGMLNCNDNVIAIVAFALLEVMSIGIYCIVEGKVDAESVKSALTVAEQIADLLEQLKKDQTVVIPTDKESDKYLPSIQNLQPDIQLCEYQQTTGDKSE